MPTREPNPQRIKELFKENYFERGVSSAAEDSLAEFRQEIEARRKAASPAMKANLERLAKLMLIRSPFEEIAHLPVEDSVGELLRKMKEARRAYSITAGAKRDRASASSSSSSSARSGAPLRRRAPTPPAPVPAAAAAAPYWRANPDLWERNFKFNHLSRLPPGETSPQRRQRLIQEAKNNLGGRNNSAQQAGKGAVPANSVVRIPPASRAPVEDFLGSPATQEEFKQHNNVRVHFNNPGGYVATAFEDGRVDYRPINGMTVGSYPPHILRQAPAEKLLPAFHLDPDGFFKKGGSVRRSIRKNPHRGW